MARREQGPEEFLDLVVGIQSRRMDDQRAALPFLPGLQHPAQVLGPHLVRRNSENSSITVPNGDSACLFDAQRNGSHQLDDDFIEMLIRCQVCCQIRLFKKFFFQNVFFKSTRIDEQRSELPKKAKPVAVTVPDDDFFQLLLKMQARR